MIAWNYSPGTNFTKQAIQKRNRLDPNEVDDVIAGVVSQVNEQGAHFARNAGLAAGWPDAVSAVSLNRFCGSDLRAINAREDPRVDDGGHRAAHHADRAHAGEPEGPEGRGYERILHRSPGDSSTSSNELERANKTTALVTMYIGGGQAISTIIQRV